ncbi:Cytochrome P450 6k1 [Trachymyrmex zeteki]|uniref:Cytochrome P450 6k1 n=2 Tax=Mycetomoellerius zeteki TaxID=64791 RepID=A0A151X069_9HYME|nr:PREDICTED: cytochrome P450 6k1-like isoform X2 [Trachymyrmex zeteki]KYQ53752.1 Cytochrome P450 6k1 [Trachymyrmex zeteki]
MDCLIYYTSALIISFSLFYAYAKYKLSYWSRRGVKSPPTHLFFGNFKDCITLKKSPGEKMREIYNSADPDDLYIGFYIFHKPLLLLRDHDLIKQVMIKDFDVFPNRRFGSGSQRDPIGLDSILSMHQPKWKYVRNKLTPVLTGQKLKNMIPLMIESGKPMLNFIENLPTNEDGWSVYEIKDISVRYSTDILASLTFGININSFDDNETAFCKTGVTIFRGFMRGIVFIIQFFLPDWDFLVVPFIKGPANYLRNIFWDSMNTRERLGFKRGDMIDFMLALKNGEQNPIYKFEGDNLVAQPSSLYIAGFEAIGTAIAYALYDLGQHPEHQDTIYNEIQTQVSGKELTMDLINGLSFLNSVVVESLRLHPPLPVTDRITTRDYELPGSGLIIEKNIPVYVSINATNQDPKYFSNPQNFIPLRTEAKNKKKFYESLAFGIGPRSCIGQRCALLIVKVAIIMIISNYTISSKANKKHDNNAIHVFTYSSDGLYIQFKKRN